MYVFDFRTYPQQNMAVILIERMEKRISDDRPMGIHLEHIAPLQQRLQKLFLANESFYSAIFRRYGSMPAVF